LKNHRTTGQTEKCTKFEHILGKLLADETNQFRFTKNKDYLI